jgi:hypothetical protein
MTNPQGQRGNPIVRIVLSLATLGCALYFVIQQGKPPKKEPVAPHFRSRTPSAEGSGSFAWIPRYPGAVVTNIRTQETEKELIYALDFQSSDAPADIASYYERGLRAAGFTVDTRKPTADETNLHAESITSKRSIDIGIDKVQSGTLVSVTAKER